MVIKYPRRRTFRTFSGQKSSPSSRHYNCSAETVLNSDQILWMRSHPRDAQSLHALCDLCAVHQQGVNDPVSPLPAAYSLHTAVVLPQSEMRLCAVVHKFPLQGEKIGFFCAPQLQKNTFCSTKVQCIFLCF